MIRNSSWEWVKVSHGVIPNQADDVSQSFGALSVFIRALV